MFRWLPLQSQTTRSCFEMERRTAYAHYSRLDLGKGQSTATWGTGTVCTSAQHGLALQDKRHAVAPCGKVSFSLALARPTTSLHSGLPVTRAQFFLFISPLAPLRSLYPYSGIRETHCCSVLSQVRSRDRNRDSHTPKRHHPPT